MPVLERDELRSQSARRPSRHRQPARDRRLPSPAQGRARRRDPRLPASDADAGADADTEDAPERAPRSRSTRTRGGRARSAKSAAAEEPEEEADAETARRPTPTRIARRAGGAAERHAGAGARAARPTRTATTPTAARRRPPTSARPGASAVPPPPARSAPSRAWSSCSATAPAFLRVDPPEPSDDDVYVSAAQVRRCELVSGDRISGPARAPRRSERYPSLVRVDTINGASADSVAEGTHFDDLPVGFPSERVRARRRGSDAACDRMADADRPRLARVIVGAARSGKSEALRRLAGALAAQEGLDVELVLAGVRPEEVAEWQAGPATPSGRAQLRRVGRRPGSGGRAGRRHGPSRRRPRRQRRPADRLARGPAPAGRSPRARRRPQPRRRRLADRDRHGARTVRWRDDGHHARRGADQHRAAAGPGPRQQRHAAPRAARRRRPVPRRSPRRGPRRSGRPPRT